MIDYTLILNKKYEGKEWVLDGDFYEGLNWLDDSPKPSKEELDSLWESVKEEVVAEKEDKETARQAILARLGITAEEAALLLSV